MGDPKKLRAKYSKPSHPWQKLRIEEEKVLMKEYGFKNKEELWRLNSVLSNYKNQVKTLIPKRDETAEQQKKHLLEKVQKYGLIGTNAILEDILAVSLKDLCERRLQTIVAKKGIARSVKQSRQFIVHEHILVGERKITSPSYLLTLEEEATVRISEDSPFVSDSHPERQQLEKEIKMEKEKIMPKKVEVSEPESVPEEVLVVNEDDGAVEEEENEN